MSDTAMTVRLFGDAFGIGVLVLTLGSFVVTTVLAMRVTNLRLVSAGHSELTAVVGTLLVGFVLFIGGWLVVDAVWLFTKAPRSVARRFGRSERT